MSRISTAASDLVNLDTTTLKKASLKDIKEGEEKSEEPKGKNKTGVNINNHERTRDSRRKGRENDRNGEDGDESMIFFLPQTR